MRAMVVAGTGLSLAVGFHQEAAEVGYELIDFLGLGPPPACHGAVQRVGRLRLTQSHGGGKVDAQERLDAIGAQ